MNIKSWISAFRLRTLPLAISSILMGTFLANLYHSTSWIILILALFTAISLQILSNLSNDYGDFTKGTDNAHRIGNPRALQSGTIQVTHMRMAIIVNACISLISGLCLLYVSSGGRFHAGYFILLFIGLAAIAAAIKYTVGRNPYGYLGLGDFFVFIFFGLVAVIGTSLLQTGFTFELSSQWPVLLPAAAIGLLCVGVLNTNNIRDIENDGHSGKQTIPVKLGLRNARIYHTVLIILSFTCLLLSIWLHL